MNLKSTLFILSFFSLSFGYSQVSSLTEEFDAVTNVTASASDATKLSQQRYYTFRFTYQASGSTTF